MKVLSSCSRRRYIHRRGASLVVPGSQSPPILNPDSTVLPRMSTTETTKSAKRNKKAKSSGGGQKVAERLKTVVRRLPPNLPEEIFWQSVSKWVTEETVTWKAYYPGKFKTRYVSLCMEVEGG